MPNSNEKTVITGVGGLVGFHLADRICRENPGATVIGIARSINPNIEELQGHPGFHFIAADLLAAPELPDLLSGAQTVFHLAAQSAVFRARQDPMSDLRINIQGTLQLMLCAADAGVSKVVYTSGGAVYQSQAYAREESAGRPPSFYGASKLAAESYVRIAGDARGVRYTILRLSRIYGPRMTRGAIFDLLHDFQARRPANIFAHPDSIFDFLFVQDAVSALLLASGQEWDGATANISCGQGTRLRDLHANFCGHFGYSVPIHPWEGDPSVEVLVNDRARSMGWEPRYTLQRGLVETLRHFLPDLFCP